MHVDHLNRPVRLTDSTKAAVWDVIYTPWGAPQTVTGTQTLDARFPGQWFQLEAGLHYNWHRHYDPTLGRYTQPDPLGFVDGPSVYEYAGSRPSQDVDLKGLYRMCHRPLNSSIFGWTHYRHCFLAFDDGSTLSFDPQGVHPDPLPDTPYKRCTAEQDKDKDNCLKREMNKCTNCGMYSNNCCHCVARALKACGTNVPPQSFPSNDIFN